MAIRTVFLRFSSNANVFAADMTRVAQATQVATKAAEQEAFASEKVEQAKSKIVTVNQSLTASEAALARLSSQRAAYQIGADAAQASGDEAMLERKRRQIATTEELMAKESEEAAVRKAELAELTAAQERYSATIVEQQAIQERALTQQGAASASLTGRVGTSAMLGGAAVLFGFYEAAKAAAEFEGEMQKVAAISDVTRNNLAQMSSEVINLSKELPASANEFAQSLLVAEQAGYHGYQAISLLRTASEGATVGFSSQTDATKDLARVLNGFGLEAKDATSVNNVLVAAVQNGIGSYHSFGEALAQIGPLAKAAHISLNDAAGAIAAMSSKGIEASGAGMGLIRMIFNMGKEGSSTEKTFVDLVNSTTKFHVENGAAALSTLGLSGTLELLGKQTRGSSSAIEALFPSVRQAKAAFALLSDGAGEAITMMHLFNNQEKLAEDEATAWATAQQSTSVQLKIAGNQIQDVGIELGSKFLPMLASTAKFVAGLVETFGDLNDKTGGLAGTILTGAAAFGVLFGVVSKLVSMGQATVAMFTTSAAAKAADAAASEALAGAQVEAAATAETLAEAQGQADLALAVLGEESAVTAAALEALAVAEVEAATAAEALVVAEEAVEVASGPIGWVVLGISALAAAFGIYSSQSQGATDLTKDFTKALDEEQSGVTGATATLILHQDATAGLISGYNAVGVSIRDVTEAITASGTGTAAQVNVANQLTAALLGTDEQLQKNGQSQKNIADLHSLVQRAVEGDSGALQGLTHWMWENNPAAMKQLSLLGQITAQRQGHNNALSAQTDEEKQLTEQTKLYNRHLANTGEQLDNVDESLKKLTPDQVEIQKAMQGFIDLGSAMDEATKRTIDNQATFTSGADIFKDILKDQQKALDDQAQAQADSYNAALTDSTQAAQDAARTNNEVIHDTVATTTSVTKIGADSQTAIIRNAANSQKELAHDAKAANQDAAREVSRANQDARKSADDFKQTATISKDEYIKALAESAYKTVAWRNDLDAVAKNGGSQAVLDNLRKLGQDGVPLIHEFATASKDEIDSINASFSTLAPTAEASYDEFQKAMLQQMTDESAWEKNLEMLAFRGGGDLADQFIQLAKKQGKKSSGALAEALKLSDADLKAANDQAIEYGKIGSDGYTQNFEEKFTALKRAAEASGTDSGKAFVDSMSQEFGVLGFNDGDVMNFLRTFQKQIEAYSPALARELFGGSLGDAPDALSNQEGRGTTPGTGVREGKDQGSTPGPGVSTSIPQAPTIRPPLRLSADGNIFQFAGGTENHVAQFAQGGDWRLWAEPETGGEAYIPLSPSKRGRSMSILNAVASEFGYGLVRDGATRPTGSQLAGTPGRAGDSQVTHVVVQQPVSKKTEYNFTGPIMGYRLEQVTADADRRSRLAALSGGR